MQIILTHEQTDFDALASMFGAYLLNNTAFPILPRRINRNVRAFLTLYGVDLPFIDPRDLPGERISSVCLVDTQSLTSVKGMDAHTKVRVIDHHTKRNDIPDDWDISTDLTGANTTIFIEAIQEKSMRLNIVQATLLLLGIYEDTGSLTYSRTTPRDVRAAAFLLEQGANLSLATDFLNHPLSLDQQNIYDQLRKDAEILTIHGHSVIIAPGDAHTMDEELSTIAHKLRDLLDPDAIFLIINIRGGVQLIARSTSENINVAKISENFRGGGHPRAAAALVKDRDRSQVYDELKEILPEYIHPAVTVGEIMSRALPKILSPTTPVKTAAERMQRYGYEGYPVVDGKVILGLLTRRAVDRAITHKLNLTAASLMEAGSIAVKPDDSIEHLQKIMTESGWGQVPVQDDEQNIIGIVTRTDLLKTLAPTTPQPGTRNLSNKLKNALPPARLSLLCAIAEIATNKQIALYIVGGFVRDLILERPSLDVDLVVEGDAIELGQAVQKEFGGRLTSHTRFGTAKWFIKDSQDELISRLSHVYSRISGEDAKDVQLKTGDLPGSLDLITARTEFYTHPTALPTVERSSIKLDLHRRDFTINTLALRLDGHHYGELFDYWGGLNDIDQGIVRVLHSLSFVDDPTRMLRAVRYEQRYGFTIGDRTIDLLMEAVRLMDRVSGDRIRHEINNIFEENQASEMLDRLSELGLLEAIHPALTWDDWYKKHFEKIQEYQIPREWSSSIHLKTIPVNRALKYIYWLVRKNEFTAASISKRLKLPRVLAKSVQDACILWHQLDDFRTAKPSYVTEKLDKASGIAIFAVKTIAEDSRISGIFDRYNSKWRQIKPQIDGNDLKRIGVAPGPHYKEILRDLKNALIDGELHTHEDQMAFIKTRISKYIDQ